MDCRDKFCIYCSVLKVRIVKIRKITEQVNINQMNSAENMFLRSVACCNMFDKINKQFENN